MGNTELLKSFSQNCKEFRVQRSEEVVNNLQRCLQILSASSDTSVFDPGSREVVEFLVNLHELMTGLEPRHPLTWTCLSVLKEACRNPAARSALIHTYKFAPLLSRLLLYQNLSHERKLLTLSLLQELSYGIRISWQEAHLPQLITLLTQWISSDEDQVTSLSLGVLVNLCYKNLPTIYTLMRTVNIKSFLKLILQLQKYNTNTRVQVCKLLIILECVSGNVDNSEVETYVKAMRPTLVDALAADNPCLMRHIVDFFKEIISNSKWAELLQAYPNYSADIEAVMKAVDQEESISTECVSAVLEYIMCISQMGNLSPELSGRLTSLALRWVRTEGVATKALELLSFVAISSEESSAGPLVDNLEGQLDTILVLLDIGDKAEFPSQESFTRLSALLQLLAEMIQVPNLCAKISSTLSHSMIRNLFSSLLLRSDMKESNNIFQEPVYTFYVQALCFLLELANRSTDWLLVYSELVQETQVQKVLAVALYTGSNQIKKKVLSLIGTAGFTPDCYTELANRMSEVNKLVIFAPGGEPGRCVEGMAGGSYLSPMDLTPVLTIAQEDQLNAMLDKCDKLAKTSNVTTSAILELLQYKRAVMSHTMRQMQRSQEAADERATKLQHSLALMGAEVARLHQVLGAAQQGLEAKSAAEEKVVAHLEKAKAEATTLHNQYVELRQSLRSKTIIIAEQSEQLEKARLASEEADRELEETRVQVRLLEEVVRKSKEEHVQTTKELDAALEACKDLKASLTVMSQKLEAAHQASAEDKKEIECRNQKIEAFRKEIVNQKSVITKLEKALVEKERTIGNINKELQDMKRMGEIISELATGKRKLETP